MLKLSLNKPHPSESWDPLQLLIPFGFNNGSGQGLKSGVVLCAVFILASFMFTNTASAKTLQFQDQTWEVFPITNSSVISFSVRNDLDLKNAAKQAVLGSANLQTVYLLDDATVELINDITSKINQQARDAALKIENGKATEFEPGQNGQALDVYALRQLLASTQEQLPLPVVISTPEKKLADTNSFGINELVGLGESAFTGSPKNRIHNITVGASKYNGLIIEQDQEFSFNEYLGEVDDEHGFLPELVIKASGVTPEFGGGLCQVSSTTFRAAMNAGLPITARRNHSFAVQYYAPQGTDATIYPGSQDLKFVNNLKSKMLIKTKIEGTKLYFEFYGTKDDRTIVFEGPTVYDKKTDGSMKATWGRTVRLNGETSAQTFNSIYRSPALYHPTEQATTPNPDANPTPPPAPSPTT